VNKLTKATANTVYFVLSYLVNGVRFYVDTVEETMIDMDKSTPAEARKFTSLGELLDWAQRRGRKHESASLLSRFQIVRVEETTVAGAAEPVRRLAEGELINGAQAVVLTNRDPRDKFFPGWFLKTTSTDAQGQWTKDITQARVFSSRGAAVQFVISGQMPSKSGIDNVEFVMVRANAAKPVIKVTETVL
jgi:hypothetical protein